jgi:plastocyanin
MSGSRSRRLMVPALVAGSFLALAWGPLPGVRPAAAQTGAALHISMKDFMFKPATPPPITVGTTVTWTYDESATDPMPNCETPVLTTQCPGHTATASTKGPDGKAVFDSGTLKKAGASYSFTFTKAGTYNYYCVYHGGTTATGKNNPVTNMNGTLVVEGEAQATPAPSSNTAQSSATPTPAATQVQGQSATQGATNNAGLANTGGPAIFGWGLLPLAAAVLLLQWILHSAPSEPSGWRVHWVPQPSRRTWSTTSGWTRRLASRVGRTS